MIVTPDMPKEPGGTVESHGALLELANVIGWDDSGVKVTSGNLFGDFYVKVETDSFGYPHSTTHLNPDDAEYLGNLLIRLAAETRAAQARYDG